LFYDLVYTTKLRRTLIGSARNNLLYKYIYFYMDPLPLSQILRYFPRLAVVKAVILYVGNDHKVRVQVCDFIILPALYTCLLMKYINFDKVCGTLHI
jgi:hypothetical protein